MIKRVWYAVIGIVCFLIVTAVLALPSLLLQPGAGIGSMPAAYGIAAVISYYCTPIIYRKIAAMRKR
ncbi:MAG: hypothetical protein AB9917_06700 [Negativicutes bacterium]